MFSSSNGNGNSNIINQGRTFPQNIIIVKSLCQGNRSYVLEKMGSFNLYKWQGRYSIEMFFRIGGDGGDQTSLIRFF